MFVQSVYLLVNWEGTVKICALYPISFVLFFTWQCLCWGIGWFHKSDIWQRIYITQTVEINFVCVLNFRMWQMPKGRKARCWWESKSDQQISELTLIELFGELVGRIIILSTVLECWQCPYPMTCFEPGGRFLYKRYGAARRKFWKGSCLVDIAWNVFHP